jgi:hypothetical protein
MSNTDKESERTRQECVSMVSSMELSLNNLENTLLRSTNPVIENILEKDEFQNIEDALRRIQRACEAL